MLSRGIKVLLISVGFLLLLFSIDLQAQSKKGKDDKLESEIHLKNDWIIRGKILSETSEFVRIETRDGNVFVFQQDKIERIELVKKPREVRRSEGSYNRLCHLSEWGILTGKNVSRSDRNISFSMYNATGMWLNNQMQLSLGYGVDSYREVVIAPLVLDFRVDVLKKSSFTPYFFSNVGYGFAISNRSDDLDNNPLRVWDNFGGIRYNLGAGIKLRTSEGSDWMISVGYLYQKSRQEKDYWTGGFLEKTIQYRRLSIRTGLTF